MLCYYRELKNKDKNSTNNTAVQVSQVFCGTVAFWQNIDGPFQIILSSKNHVKEHKRTQDDGIRGWQDSLQQRAYTMCVPYNIIFSSVPLKLEIITKCREVKNDGLQGNRLMTTNAEIRLFLEIVRRARALNDITRYGRNI